MAIIGCKNNKDLFNNLLKPLIPNDIFNIDVIYIEPFGGEFGLYDILDPKPPVAIYNDIDKELYENVKIKFGNGIYKNRAWRSPVYYNLDYKELLEMYNSDNVFIYADPPYLLGMKNHPGYYKYNFKEKDHYELADILKNTKSRFLLSYQDRPLMRELYKGYNFYKYAGNNFILRPEIAITNY